MLSQLLWPVDLLSVIAAVKVLIMHFFWEDELKHGMNFCPCSSAPVQSERQPSAGKPAAPDGDGGKNEQEILLLHQRVQQLTAECADLRRKNTELEQVLAYIRSVVFDAAGAWSAPDREGTT